MGLAGAAVAKSDNERTPPAAWTQSPGTEERPVGSAARRPEAARQGLKTGGPQRHEQHCPQRHGLNTEPGAVIMAVSAKASG